MTIEEQVRKMARLGLPARVIAKQLGIYKVKVERMLAAAREEGLDTSVRTGFGWDGKLTIVLDGDLLARVIDASLRANAHPTEGVLGLLEMALDDARVRPQWMTGCGLEIRGAVT